MYISTLLTSLFQMFLMILLGFFLRKKEVITAEGVSELSRLLVAVILPLSVFASGNESCDPHLAYSLIESAVIVFAYYILAFVISFLIYKVFQKNKARLGVSITMSVFANIGFMGMPLAKILYGSDGLLIAVIYNLIYNLFLFTVGIRCFGGSSWTFSWRETFLDPLTISSVVAIVLFISPYKIPDVINSVVVQIGDMTAPISMLIIGAQMVNADWKRVFASFDSYLVCIIRLLVFPLLMLFVLKQFVTDSVLIGTIVLLTALPIGSLNAIFAEKYDADVAYVNETLILSLILSVVTIPIVMGVLLK